MTTDPQDPAAPTWPALAGAASVSAPFLAMGLTAFARTLAAPDSAFALIAKINLGLVSIGLVLGIAGVVGAIRADRRRWLFRAMVGTVMCAMAVAIGIGSFAPAAP